MKKINFYVYPTLLDAYSYAKKSGNYNDLIDKINRVKKEMPEFVLKGSAFEKCINAGVDGVKVYSADGFSFDTNLVDKLSNKLVNTVKKQKWIEKTVDFDHGVLRIGGFVDYLLPNRIVDLKTCINYRLGKYSNHNQHKAYGLILEDEVKDFIYLATDLTNYYVEPYENKKIYHQEFINDCEEFYLFCKENENLITDNRIFGN